MLKRFYIIGVLVLISCVKESSEERLENNIIQIQKLQESSIKKANDSSLIYLNQVERIIEGSPRIPDTFGIENIFLKGFYYKQINKIDSASHYFHKTIDLIEAPNLRARNYVYFKYAWETDESNSKLANAISTAHKFIEISHDDKNAKGLTFAYNSLERMTLALGNYEKALEYNTKALEAAKKSSNTGMYIITLNSRADNLYHSNEKEKAYKLLDSVSNIETESADVKRQLIRNYGVLNFYDENYKSAIEKYKIALQLSKEIEANKNTNIIESYNNIAEAYMLLENYELTKKYLDSTQAIIQPNSYPPYITFYNELRFKLNYRTKKNEDDLLKEYLKLIKDLNKQHEDKIAEELVALKVSNEKETLAKEQKKEAEITNIKLISLLGFSILLMLIGYLFFRQRRFKFEKKDMQMQQRLLRSQMSPHFMFNTLSAIQNQIKDSKVDAANYLLKFSRLLRLILENSLNDYVQIENELESLRKYIDLQLLRFPNQFEYSIVLENFEEDELLFIPPMLIQPFVENSIEYGFFGVDYKGQIHIKLELQDKFIMCSIDDNGLGLQESNTDYKKSISTQLISNFIFKSTKKNILILDKKVESLIETGVLVRFLIPYKFSEND
ncbi:hypothetical protein A9Q86_05835 [Flavobacteriales bacterium 33_180_T64]|nr:hypothetical protein A9Q86_05835 [Flavobacteriales bacterium 33_180_T64]